MAKKSKLQTASAESEWISLREASRIYGVSTDTLRRRISTGELPAVKLGYKNPSPPRRPRQALPADPSG